MLKSSASWSVTAAVLALSAASSGCLVVSDAHLKSFDGGGNTGDGALSQDSGQIRFDDSCGAANPRLILTDTTRGIEIDTTAGYTSRNSSSCGGETPGNDVFIAVDVVEGEIWHFHLSAVSANRQPMLFLTQATRCDSRTCQYVSSSCEGPGDEHFAFVADATGRWFIGIDDGAEGGGQYVLEAYRPVCGDGMEVHGEACDDGNVVGGDGCDRNCRVELSEARTAEFEPNDNLVEANAIILPQPANELQITGTIGGPGACTYPDVFALDVPPNFDLEVDMLNSDGSPCAAGATTPFQLVLQRATGQTVVENMTDANGCATIRAATLNGAYFIRIQQPQETPTPTPYRMRVRVVP